MITPIERRYRECTRNIMLFGDQDEDRTGTGTLALSGELMVHEATEGVRGISPCLLSKRVFIPAVVHELLWMISGSTNIKYLHDHNITIWDEWADEGGELGPIYGKQWRDVNGIDQLQQAIDSLRNNPSSRRMIVNSWNVNELSEMALTPCHCFFQFTSKPIRSSLRNLWASERNVHFNHSSIPDRTLNINLTQRSADIFLGVPFNLLAYFILASMVAHVTRHAVGKISYFFGDLHLYNNHVDQANELLSRDSLVDLKPLMFIIPSDHPAKEIGDFTYEDIMSFFGEYKPLPTIKAPISV